jgi:hypothetical protein
MSKTLDDRVYKFCRRIALSLLHPSPLGELFALIRTIASEADTYVVFKTHMTLLNLPITRERATILAQIKRSIPYIGVLGDKIKASAELIKRMTQPSDYEIDRTLGRELSSYVEKLMIKYRGPDFVPEEIFDIPALAFQSAAATFNTSRSEGGFNAEMKRKVKEYTRPSIFAKATYGDDPSPEGVVNSFYDLSMEKYMNKDVPWKAKIAVVGEKGVKDRIVTKNEAELLFLLNPLAQQCTRILKRIPGLKEQFSQSPEEVAKRLPVYFDSDQIISLDKSAATDNIKHEYAVIVIEALGRALEWDETTVRIAKSSVEDIELYDGESVYKVTRGTQMGLPLSFVILSLLNLFGCWRASQEIEKVSRGRNGEKVSLFRVRKRYAVHGDDTILVGDKHLKDLVTGIHAEFGFISNDTKSHVSKHGGTFAGSYYYCNLVKTEKKVKIDFPPLPTNGNDEVILWKKQVIRQSTLKPFISFKASIVTGSSSSAPSHLYEVVEVLESLDRRYNGLKPTIFDLFAEKFQKQLEIIAKMGVPLVGPVWAGCVGFKKDKRIPLLSQVDKTTRIIIGTNYSKKLSGKDVQDVFGLFTKCLRLRDSSMKTTSVRDLKIAIRNLKQFALQDAVLSPSLKKGYVHINLIDEFLPMVLKEKSLELTFNHTPLITKPKGFLKVVKQIRKIRSNLIKLSTKSSQGQRREISLLTGTNWLNRQGFQIRINGLKILMPKEDINLLRSYYYNSSLFKTRSPPVKKLGRDKSKLPVERLAITKTPVKEELSKGENRSNKTSESRLRTDARGEESK